LKKFLTITTNVNVGGKELEFQSTHQFFHESTDGRRCIIESHDLKMGFWIAREHADKTCRFGIKRFEEKDASELRVHRFI